MKKLLLVLFSLFIATSCWAANTYYIANAGSSDSYDGTQQTHTTGTTGPWETIAKVNAATFAAGDSVLFNRGDTFNDAALVVPSSSSGVAITFSNYGTGAKPIIDVPNTSDTGFYINAKNNITVDGLSFTGGKDGKYQISITSSGNCIIKNCDFTGILPHSAINATGGSSLNGLTIQDNTFTSSAHTYQVINVGTTGSILNGATITGNTIDTTSGGGIHIDSSNTAQTYLANGYIATNVNISNNTISNTAKWAICISAGSNFTINGNVCTNIGDNSEALINALQCNALTDSTISGNSIDTVDTNGVGDGIGIIMDRTSTKMTGTVDINGTVNVAGTGTTFTAELASGDVITVGDETRVVDVITDDDTLTVTSTFAHTHSGVAPLKVLICEDVTVKNNIVTNTNKEGATNSSGISNLYAKNTLIYNNIVYDCTRGIKTYGANYDPRSSGHKIYNNTIYNMVSSCIDFLNGEVGAECKNNIMSTAAYGIRVDSTSTMPTSNYNCFNVTKAGIVNVTEYTTLANWQGATGTPDLNSISSDPLFISASDYHLQAGSPCIEKGATLATVTDDYEGNSRPQGNYYDIGAYEYKVVDEEEDVIVLEKLGFNVIGTNAIGLSKIEFKKPGFYAE